MPDIFESIKNILAQAKRLMDEYVTKITALNQQEQALITDIQREQDQQKTDAVRSKIKNL